MDLNLHGKEASVVAGLLAAGVISDSKVAANAAIQQSKIAGLVSDLAAIVASVTAEVNRASAAEAALDVQISEEVTRALAAEEALEGRLDTLQGADSLQGSVAYSVKQEQTRAMTEEGSIRADFAAADNVLQGMIEDEELRATTAEGVIAADLAQEILDRIADVDAEELRAITVETTINSNLIQEVLDRQQAVSNEEARALAAEGVIAANLAQEILDRVADVDAEELRATTAETALQGLIDSETQRATAAEGEIAGDLAEEIARALAAEADLSSLKYDKAGGEIDGNVEITGTLEVAGTSTFTGDVTASGNLTVQGDLVINGNMTSVNSVDMVVNDRLVHLNEPATAGANDPVPTGLAGVSIHRGSDAGVEREHAGMVWDEAAQKFVFQMLDADAAGSTKLGFEAKNIMGETLRLITENGPASCDIEASVGRFETHFNNGDEAGDFQVEIDGISLDSYDLTNGVYALFKKDEFHIERTADNYATYSQFDINPDGVQLRDGANNPLMPLNDEHLVVKKYVDDAGDALQANIDLKFNKAGGAIDTDGVVTFDSSANNSTLSLGAESIQLHYEAETHVSHYELTNHFEVSISDSTLGGGVNFMLQQSGLSVETSADNNQTFVSVNFLADGISMLDETLAPVMPQADEHLVVKKYVDDAIAALDSSSNGDLAAETAARIAADLVLDGKITDEELRATAAEGVISANLAQEVLDRVADVEAEELRATTAEGVLQTNITAEETRAMAEELDIRNDFAAADLVLDGKIMAEETRAMAEEADIRLDFAAADALLQTAVDNEVLRAQNEEADIRADFAAADATTLSSAEAYTDQKIADLVDSAPALLDTLNELAAALGDDPNFSTTVLNAISAEQTRAEAAEVALDGRLDTLEAKSFREVFIDNSVGGEVELLKPVGAPAIPNSAAVEFYIDGRKMRRDVHFEVAEDGSKVTFSALDAGVMVELRYFA
jgi:Ca2+-binding EF-hand superfamily protein